MVEIIVTCKTNTAFARKVCVTLCKLFFIATAKSVVREIEDISLELMSRYHQLKGALDKQETLHIRN